MNRLFPFSMMSLILILIFFNVNFLTQKKSQISRNIMENQLIKLNQNFEKEKNKLLTEVIKDKKHLLNKKNILEDITKQNSSNKKNENKNLGKVIIDSFPANQFKQYYVQYGVYKTKKNLVKLEESIENKLKKKFQNINLIIVKKKDDVFYRLILPTNSKSLANDVCKYSKSIELECYVKK